jgi:hypothetical protein
MVIDGHLLIEDERDIDEKTIIDFLIREISVLFINVISIEVLGGQMEVGNHISRNESILSKQLVFSIRRPIGLIEVLREQLFNDFIDQFIR